MTRDPDQQELTESMDHSFNRTWQERVMRLYRSNSLYKVSAGFWAKVVIEGAIIGIPLLVFIAGANSFSTWMGGFSLSLGEMLFSWGVVTVGLFEATWCFTENQNRIDEETEEL